MTQTCTTPPASDNSGIDWLTIDGDRLRVAQPANEVFDGFPERFLEVAAVSSQRAARPDRDIVRAAQFALDEIAELPRSVWRTHFNAILMGARPSAGLRFLHAGRILPVLLPEVCAMVDFHKSCAVHHKDIWDHTLQVVDKCPVNLAVRWIALMHDTGKVWTRSVNARGKVHFFRHEELGATLMRGVARRFELPETLATRVIYVISNHARANVYADTWTDSAVRRLIRDMGEHLDDVIAFSQSDYTTKQPARIREVQRLAGELNERLARIKQEDAKVPPLPKGFGTHVIAQTGRRGGPWLGRIQRWLEGQVDDGTIAGGLNAEQYLAFLHDAAPELLLENEPEDKATP
jgi:poly(A) polymerase